MSTYLVPQNQNIELVFEDIIEDVSIVKDEIGQVLWPSFNMNTIGDMEIGAGYQVKMNEYNILEIEGSLVPYNTEFQIEQGWNIIGYLHQDAYNIENMMDPIIDELLIIKNENGDVFWPLFDLNSIN